MDKDLILVIDDNPAWLNLARLILIKEGYEVLVAHSGELGISLVESQRPALIVLDIMMPKMSGLDICRHIRATPSLAHTPILVTTAVPEIRQHEALDAGANIVLQKPVNIPKLHENIRNLLGEAKL